WTSGPLHHSFLYTGFEIWAVGYVIFSHAPDRQISASNKSDGSSKHDCNITACNDKDRKFRKCNLLTSKCILPFYKL
ncbi:hypothetical protein NQ315_003877, partial [Exocentrus adspersus]